MLFGEILRRAALRSPQQVAVIAGAREIPFAEFDRLANRCAHALIAHGVRPGDRIACQLRNSPEYGLLHFGAARVGAVLVHIAPVSAPAEVDYILERTAPRLTVTEADRDRLRGNDEAPLPDPVGPEAPAAMTFTGGTTGRPRGALVSHRARALSAHSTAREHRLGSGDVVGVVTPMSHAVGLLIWFQAALVAGATSVLFSRWDPEEFASEVARRGITAVFLVPSQVRDLLRVDPARLRSLVNLGVGGAPSSPELIEAWAEHAPWCGYTDHYGQSETGPLTILKPGDARARAGTIGQPARGVDLKVAGPDGAPVPPGATGELVVRGPFLMEGYYREPEQTARYFRHGDGWGWTGDLGFMDHDGFVTLVGRSVERIVTGGLSVHPREIEAALEAHPAVSGCAVFGVPDPRWGEAPIALVQTVCPVTTEALEAHLDARLSRHKRPREIVFADRIPRTASGKIKKAQLRDNYLRGTP